MGRWAAALVGVLIVAAAIAGGVASRARSARSQEGHRVEGTVMTRGYTAPVADGSYCVGSTIDNIAGGVEDFTDLDATTQVVVRDQDGVIVGTAILGPSEVRNHNAATPAASPLSVCAWSFAVQDLPDRPFYEFTIGRQAPRVRTAGEMARNSWRPTILLAYGTGD
jgi:hypothetical protein